VDTLQLIFQVNFNIILASQSKLQKRFLAITFPEWTILKLLVLPFHVYVPPNPFFFHLMLPRIFGKLYKRLSSSSYNFFRRYITSFLLSKYSLQLSQIREMQSSVTLNITQHIYKAALCHSQKRRPRRSFDYYISWFRLRLKEKLESTTETLQCSFDKEIL